MSGSFEEKYGTGSKLNDKSNIWRVRSKKKKTQKKQKQHLSTPSVIDKTLSHTHRCAHTHIHTCTRMTSNKHVHSPQPDLVMQMLWKFMKGSLTFARCAHFQRKTWIFSTSSFRKWATSCTRRTRRRATRRCSASLTTSGKASFLTRTCATSWIRSSPRWRWLTKRWKRSSITSTKTRMAAWTSMVSSLYIIYVCVCVCACVC